MRELPGMITIAIASIALGGLRVGTITAMSRAETARSALRRITAQSARARPSSMVGSASKWAAGAVTAIAGPLSLVPDPRIEPRVGEIHQQVQAYEGARHQHHV